MIFDVDSMKKAMLEFEIDLKKMPLGKLSKAQIESAYKVLTELLQVNMNILYCMKLRLITWYSVLF